MVCQSSNESLGIGNEEEINTRSFVTISAELV